MYHKNGLKAQQKEIDSVDIEFKAKLLTVSRYGVSAKELISNGFKVDYVKDINNRRYAAVYLGNVRLIDNVEL